MLSSTVCVLIIRQLWDIVQWHFEDAVCYLSQPASVCDHCTFFVILSLEEDDRESRWDIVVSHDEHTKDSADDHEDMKSNVDCEEFPRREDIARFIRSCSLYEEESHTANLMDIVKCYVKSARKAKIMKILDEYFSEEEDNAEDAIFLISEVLYGGE